jgi:lon-related putative ATP-dependent protease
MQAVLGRGDLAESPLRRYAINVLVDHGATTSAPLIYEDNPTHDNLVGRIEHVSHMGALTTDFTLIKAGALHRANGGYLIVDALKLLSLPLAWGALKRALISHEVRTEPLGYTLGLVGPQGLEPEPIPIDVKVVIVGQREVYRWLRAIDPECDKLFKVVVDFAEDMDRTPESEHAFARLVASMVKRNGLRPFDAGAAARVVEEASRLAGSAEKLSVEMQGLLDLLRQANHCAGASTHAVVSADDVQRALDRRTRRIDRLPERVREEMLRGRLLVATEGARAGQANGLSVAEIGGRWFGFPVRITARVRMGGGGLIDIERESELGGPIHSKGVMILAGYLAGHYSPAAPLALSATLVFEQSYGFVEGDSASATELYALLSALADVPLSNAIAVTGSVNQQGDVQAIGGVNEKIEGFFDLCQARGLTGSQGVIIPVSNVPELMLKREIVEAVAGGRFAVYAVSNVDEGLEILTGMKAGLRSRLGSFPRGTLNARIEQRLAQFAEHARAFGHAPQRRVPRRRGAR